MNNQPKISVVIPTYNRPHLIGRAVKSVLNQTYKNIEIIIIDGSTNDETEEVIQPYLTDSRINYIHQKEIHTRTDRRFIAKARNKGIKAAKGKYIAVLDDDDFWCNNEKLEKQINFFKELPDYVVSGGGIIVVNEKNQEIRRCLCPETDEEIRKAMLFNCPFWHTTVVFKKDAWMEVGGYDEIIDFSEDWDLFLKFGKLKLGKFYNFPEYFTCFLERGKNRKDLPWRENLKFNLKLREKYRNDYPNYYKAALLSRVRYLYFHLPSSFSRFLRPVVSKIKKIVFRTPF
jgi:glycosyltransferase domain-containing protein